MNPVDTMNLQDTVKMMTSADYKERFKAEYYQLKIRFIKLHEIVDQYYDGTLNFTPTCDMSIYSLQLEYMEKYLTILEARAQIEGINLKDK